MDSMKTKFSDYDGMVVKVTDNSGGFRRTVIASFKYEDGCVSLGHPYDTETKTTMCGRSTFDSSFIISISDIYVYEFVDWKREYMKFHKDVIEDKGYDWCEEDVDALFERTFVFPLKGGSANHESKYAEMQESFNERIGEWHTFVSECMDQVKSFLNEHGSFEINLPSDRYLIISLDRLCVLKGASLENGNIVVNVSYAETEGDVGSLRCASVTFEDIAQDPITMSDFMNEFYEIAKEKEGNV